MFDGLNFLNDNTDYNNNKPIEDADFFIKNLNIVGPKTLPCGLL